MSSMDSLPPSEARFNVVSPPGGFRRILRSYDQGGRDDFDIEVDSAYGTSFWLRILPDRDEVVLDPRHEEVYIVNKAIAVFLDENREERQNPAVEVWLSINTSVTVEGMPAGTLKMWEIPHDITQIGA